MKKVLFLFALIALVHVARAQESKSLAKGFHLARVMCLMVLF